MGSVEMHWAAMPFSITKSTTKARLFVQHTADY